LLELTLVDSICINTGTFQSETYDPLQFHFNEKIYPLSEDENWT